MRQDLESPGEDPTERHRLDLALETEAIQRLDAGIAPCRDKGDNGVREMLEETGSVECSRATGGAHDREEDPGGS